jgi:hypothetical protein
MYVVACVQTEGSDSRLAFLMKQDIGFADFLAILIEQIDVPTAFLHPTSKQSSPSSSSSSSFSSSFSLSHVYQRPVRGGVGKSRKVHTSAFSISTFILGQVSVFKWRLQVCVFIHVCMPVECREGWYSCYLCFSCLNAHTHTHTHAHAECSAGSCNEGQRADTGCD